MAKIKLCKWLSEVWGKCNRGETVFRRFRKTIVVEANPSPSYVRTEKQDKVRRRYKECLKQWYSLSEEEKELYREMGRPLGLPAYQMFMKKCIEGVLAVAFSYEITIDNSANANDLSDYQVLLVINNDSEFFTVVKDRKFMEFYDSDKTTLLNHYVEEWDNINYNARIWIKIPLIPANATKKIYLKVNTSRTVDLSDPESVFDFWDDFLGDSLNSDLWAVRNYASVTVSNSVAEVKGTSGSGWGHLACLQPFSYGKVYEMRVKVDDDSGYFVIGLNDRAMSGSAIGAGLDNAEIPEPARWGKAFRNVREDSYTTASRSLSVDVWRVYTIIWLSDKVIHRLDYGVDEQIITSNLPDDNMSFIFWVMGVGKTVYVDWVRVRKFADPEPSVSYVKL